MRYVNLWKKNCVEKLCLFFTLCFFLAVPLSAMYTGEWNDILPGFIRILSSPCPLITDYFALGNLPSTFLNAGICGGVFTILMFIAEGDVASSHWGSYFLVVAHCFYGLNFLNMWFAMFGLWVHYKRTNQSFMQQLHIVMLSTAFGPLFSELLFRYPLFRTILFSFGIGEMSLWGIVLAIILGLMLGYVIPAILNGTQKMHRGYNLYNAGLAFGLIGFLVYAFLFKTFGIESVSANVYENLIYDAHGRSYGLFLNVFFFVIFAVCILFGFIDGKNRLPIYRKLIKNTGLRTNFVDKYGFETSVLNLGICGLMMLMYFNAVILLTDGAGFTGPTCGVILASVCFTSNGQHPRNVWPILLGFVSFSLFVTAISVLFGAAASWTLSTQGYINGVAFATGLCPFTGVFGKKYGVLAGIFCAVLCTSTSAIHGYFVLYNGGFTAGLTALILISILDHHFHGNKQKDIE